PEHLCGNIGRAATAGISLARDVSTTALNAVPACTAPVCVSAASELLLQTVSIYRFSGLGPVTCGNGNPTAHQRIAAEQPHQSASGNDDDHVYRAQQYRVHNTTKQATEGNPSATQRRQHTRDHERYHQQQYRQPVPV